MRVTTKISSLRFPVLVSAIALAFASARCISPESPLVEAGGECSAFTPGGSVGTDVEIDATVHLFMEASSDFTKVANEIKDKVKTACAGVASDLGASDSWSALGDEDTSILNNDGTGACNAAATRIQAILEADRSSNFALTVTRGACHVDFQAQSQCDAACDVNQACQPGSVEERCEPGQLSVICENNCQAQAFCEGTVEHSCNCAGECEATCMGQCDGACTHPDGSVTMNDPNCFGRCSASCSGTCTGACRIEEEQGINCGTNVRCRGGCTSSYTDPVCESVIRPPDCTQNMQCHASCSAKAAANPVCQPTRVELFASANASPDVQKLVATINEHLPPLIEIADTKGKIILDAVEDLSVTGQAVVEKAGDLSGKSLACAKVASKASSDASSSIRVSAMASSMVTAAANVNRQAQPE